MATTKQRFAIGGIILAIAICSAIAASSFTSGAQDLARPHGSKKVFPAHAGSSAEITQRQELETLSPTASRSAWTISDSATKNASVQNEIDSVLDRLRILASGNRNEFFEPAIPLLTKLAEILGRSAASREHVADSILRSGDHPLFLGGLLFSLGYPEQKRACAAAMSILERTTNDADLRLFATVTARWAPGIPRFHLFDYFRFSQSDDALVFVNVPFVRPPERGAETELLRRIAMSPQESKRQREFALLSLSLRAATDPEEEEFLLSLLRSDDPELLALQDAAMFAISRIASSPRPLIALLRSTASQRELRHMQTMRMRIFELLSDGTPNREIVEATREIAMDTKAPFLERHAALTNLTVMSTEDPSWGITEASQTEDLFSIATRDEDPVFRQLATMYLGSARNEDAAELLRAVFLAESDPRVRGQAIQSMPWRRLEDVAQQDLFEEFFAHESNFENKKKLIEWAKTLRNPNLLKTLESAKRRESKEIAELVQTALDSI